MKNSTIVRLAPALCIAILSSGSATAAYTYADFVVPGAPDTVLNGINNAGVMVGVYGNIDVTQPLKPGWNAFFATPGGTVTTLSPPGALSADANAVNNNGTIVGNYVVDLGGGFQAIRGFVYNGSTYQTLAVPFTDATDTVISDISDQGVIVGSWSEDFFGLGILISTYGFRATPDNMGGYTYESIDLGDSDPLSFNNTFLNSRNSAGQELATLRQQVGEQEEVHAKFLPGPIEVRYSEPTSSEATVTRLTDINNQGRIVGNVTVVEEVQPEVFEIHEFGVLLDAADVVSLPASQVEFVDLQLPGVECVYFLTEEGTMVEKECHRAVHAINDNGAVVGFYDNDDGIFRGFIGTPTLPGDFNGDQRVNAADLLQWKGDYGLNDESDADGDNDSDGADFIAWQRNVGAGPPTHHVPEPTTASLVLIAIAWLAGQTFNARRW